MLPMFMPLMLGAGLGALTSKKNPLMGGLLGAGLGAAGGALAPGLLGGASASAALPAGMAGPVAPTMGATIPGLESFVTGTTPQGLLGAASQYAKPASQMAQIAQMSGILDPQQQQPIGAPPMQQPNTGAQTLAQLAQAGDSSQQITQESAARKKRRAGLLGAA